MWKRSLMTATVAALMAVGPIGIAGATDLRGRVDGVNPHLNGGKPFPFSGARVELMQSDSRGLHTVRRAVTDGRGMYYMRRVTPGSYVIRVNGGHRYNVTVAATPTLQDVRPILFK
jgi:hypothetical protein